MIKFRETSPPFSTSCKSSSLYLKYLARIAKTDAQTFPYLRRFYHLTFLPSCFWSRLFTRLIGDKQLQKTLTSFFLVDYFNNEKIKSILLAECSWIICQTGFELRYYDCCLLRINQIHLTSTNIDEEISLNYVNFIFQFDTDEEQNKQILAFNDQGTLIEILICTSDLQMIIDTTEENQENSSPHIIELLVQQDTIASILTILMAHFDTLLEDWYPEMGTRFVQNSKGDYLVNRLVPCHQCLSENPLDEKLICRTFWLEALMLSVEKQMEIKCQKHGEINLNGIAPDLVRVFVGLRNPISCFCSPFRFFVIYQRINPLYHSKQ